MKRETSRWVRKAEADLKAQTTWPVPHDASLRSLRRALVALSRYAVDYRYPDENATKREAAAALQQATKVRAQIRLRLGLPL
ncbi:MAG: hypothetical protein MUF25_07575 [Pirellulaceae bacterium]|jgi:hypothetical protein|nr:hypothetical protein [Pirellulaceae bacterium]